MSAQHTLLQDAISAVQQYTEVFEKWCTDIHSHVKIASVHLVMVANMKTVAERSALVGTGLLTDLLVLCPGMQYLQYSAMELNNSEYPACAALTTGYVFRVENEATVAYLQKMSKTGSLTYFTVSEGAQAEPTTSSTKPSDKTWGIGQLESYIPSLAYQTILFSTVNTILFLSRLEDWWGLAAIFIMIFCRAINTIILRQRSKFVWAGASEPGVKGDLLVLLSRDRWVRIQGYVDDLKAVTSGQWLQDMSFRQRSLIGMATVLCLGTGALAINAKNASQLILSALLVESVGLLAIANNWTKVMQMHGRYLRPTGQQKQYTRRLDLAKELIHETGRDDWALRTGMINEPMLKPGVEQESSRPFKGEVKM